VALDEAREVISALYGKEYALAKPRFFKNKAKNAQEAHEAIRPTYIGKTPVELKRFLTADQFKLYDLIWKRTVASQMTDARGRPAERARGRGLPGRRGHRETLHEPALPAVHDLDPAAGGRTQAALQRPADDAGRPAAV
jgi:transposase